jgi:2-keto-3-deoxy-6-phosphogluconate aldolase
MAFQLFSVSAFARVISAFDVVLSAVRICMTAGVEAMLQ